MRMSQNASNLLPSQEKTQEQADAPLCMARRRLLQYFGAGSLALAAGSLGTPTPARGEDPGLISVIRSRRSVREYTGEPLRQETLQTVLAAGMSAPSAQNSRPWHFVVLTPGKGLHLIDRIIPMTAYTAKAGAAVLVCVDTSVEPGKEQAILSTACCAQNMLLAARALDLGAVWVSVYPSQEYVDAWREAVHLPPQMMPLCVMPIGKPIVPPQPVDRTDASRIHYETW